MSGEAREAFLKGLREAKPSLTIRDIALQVAPAAKVSADDMSPILLMLGGMYSFVASRQVTPVEFAKDLVSSIRKGEKAPALKPADDDWDALQRFLADLLSCEKSLGLSAKALEVLHEHQRFFCDARTLTDLRPIFGANTDAGPEAIVVTHILRLTYHEDEELKEFHLALAPADLRELKAVIERAEKKAASLRPVVDRMGIPRLELDKK
jgi:hypothetical protein